KTGTLTEGKPSVTDVLACAPQAAPDEALALAASLERLSEHPLAQAVVQAAREKTLPLAEARDFTNVAGKGVRGKVGTATVMVGSARLLLECWVLLGAYGERVEILESEAKTVIAVARDGELAGVIAVADTLKPDAGTAAERLRAQGVDTVMITGDNRKTAEAIAKQIGIDRVCAEVLPQDKAEQVRILQQKGQRVAFVGDGMNDAP